MALKFNNDKNIKIIVNLVREVKKEVPREKWCDEIRQRLNKTFGKFSSDPITIVVLEGESIRIVIRGENPIILTRKQIEEVANESRPVEEKKPDKAVKKEEIIIPDIPERSAEDLMTDELFEAVMGESEEFAAKIEDMLNSLMEETEKESVIRFFKKALKKKIVGEEFWQLFLTFKKRRGVYYGYLEFMREFLIFL